MGRAQEEQPTPYKASRVYPPIFLAETLEISAPKWKSGHELLCTPICLGYNEVLPFPVLLGLTSL